MMRRARAAARTALLAVLILPWMFEVLNTIGPAGEKLLAPVISDVRVDMATRGAQAACWRLRFAWLRPDVRFHSTDSFVDAEQPPDRVDGALLTPGPNGLHYLSGRDFPGSAGPAQMILCVDMHRVGLAASRPQTIHWAMIFQPSPLWRLQYAMPDIVLPPYVEP